MRELRRADQLLEACRVPATQRTGVFGPWEIARLPMPPVAMRGAGWAAPAHGVEYTILGRRSSQGFHHPYGEIVMEDTLRELRRHLPILLRARGRVLVSGLGLGCVLRGLLSLPMVEHVDVVEIDRHIITAVGPEFASNPRVTLLRGDALKVRWPAGRRWDFAWHDVWCDGEAGSLDLLHAQLLARYRPLAQRQGAWQLDRRIKRRWPDRLLNSRRREARIAA